MLNCGPGVVGGLPAANPAVTVRDNTPITQNGPKTKCQTRSDKEYFMFRFSPRNHRGKSRNRNEPMRRGNPASTPTVVSVGSARYLCAAPPSRSCRFDSRVNLHG